MAEINEVRFSRVIDKLRSIQTRTGTPMAKWLLRVRQDRFGCVAFSNVAEAVLRLHDGDRIGVAGRGSINSWQDNEDRWHNDFQVTAWTVEIDGEEVNYHKRNPEASPISSEQSRDMSRFDVQPDMPF